jgi:D-tyrosyl-tRNA(Tyr) deacylase
LCLLWEARRRKAKYGHAMPLRAMEDMQNAKVSEAAREMEVEQRIFEEKGTGVEAERRIEDVEQAREINVTKT